MAVNKILVKVSHKEPIRNENQAKYGYVNHVEMKNEDGDLVHDLIDTTSPAVGDLALAPIGSVIRSTNGTMWINDAAGDWVQVMTAVGTGGLQVPTFTTAGLPAFAVKGRLAFDTTTNKLVVDVGTAYETVTST